MEYNSTRTVQSKLYPDVAFTFKVMSEGVKTRLLATMAPDLAALRDINVDIEGVDLPRNEAGDVDMKAQVSTAAANAIMRLTDQITVIRKTRINPTYVNECFVSITGLTLDGNPSPNAQDLRERGPVNLYEEIFDAILEASELSEKEQANLKLPTTSGAVAGGQTSDSTVPTAEKTV